MRKIWFRYLFLEMAKGFLLVIFCFYFLYVLIDFSAHTKAFQMVSYSQVLFYYWCQLIKRVDILFSVALLLASIKTLSSLNLKNELVALLSAGISLKRLLNPLFLFAFSCFMLLLCNFHFLQPSCLRKLEAFEEKYFKGKNEGKGSVHSLSLPDSSLLLYRVYDSEKETFFDAYWIKNMDEIYKIQKLMPFEPGGHAECVDLLIRDQEGELVKKDSYDSLNLEGLNFEKQLLLMENKTPAEQSFFQLLSGISFVHLLKAEKMSDREARAASHFFYKLLTPFTCFLAVLIPAPFCLSFSRTLRVFLIYALSLFGIITFFTFARCGIIIGSSQVFPPLPTFLFLFTLPFIFFGYRYAKL